MQTHAPRKAGGRPERRLLRQSSHDMDVPVLRKPGRGCERHSRLCVRACVLSAAVFCVAYPMAAVVVQRLVDDAELTVQTFILKDPEESSIYVDVVGGALSMITLPLQTSLDDLRFTLLVGNSTVGQMSAGIIPLGYGGSSPIDLDGRLNITDHSGFRQLSEAVIRHETVGLSIDGIATVRAGWLGLRFRNVRVAKHVEMRGANGLAVRIRRFELLDSPARQVGVADVTPLPLHLEMEVRQSPHNNRAADFVNTTRPNNCRRVIERRRAQVDRLRVHPQHELQEQRDRSALAIVNRSIGKLALNSLRPTGRA